MPNLLVKPRAANPVAMAAAETWRAWTGCRRERSPRAERNRGGRRIASPPGSCQAQAWVVLHWSRSKSEFCSSSNGTGKATSFP